MVRAGSGCRTGAELGLAIRSLAGGVAVIQQWWATWSHFWPWFLAALMVVVAIWGEFRRVLAVRRWFRRGALERLGWRASPRTLATAMGITVAVAGAFAAARWQDARTGTLWLVIDQSRSQAAVEPDGRTRWQQVQDGLIPYVAGLKRPVAVIVFRAEAAVLVPPTRDRDSVLQTLQGLRPVLDRQGSDPAPAVRLFERLRHAQDTALLISDGEWLAPPQAATVPLVGWGLGSPARVPALPGDPATPLSRPNPAALQTLCAGHSLWGANVRLTDLARLQSAASESSRTWTLLFLLLAVIEAALVIGQRYHVRIEQLPYRWVQRWVLWRAGTAGALVLLLLLPAASDVPAWRWRSQASPAREAYNEGCLSADTGDRPAAEKAWRRAVGLDPAWQPAWYNLGTLLASFPGREKEAEQALSRAVRLDPTDRWARENLRALQLPGQARATPSGPSAPPVTAFSSAIPANGALSGGSDRMADAQRRLASGQSSLPTTSPGGQPSGLPDLWALERMTGDPQLPKRPQPLPSLRPQDIDRMLGQAETLSPEALRRLHRLRQRQGGQVPEGPVPPLTLEQLARMAALASRMGVEAQDLQRTGEQTSPFIEPATRKPTGLTW
jgi:tetratricopeptide (TPR) repeat protein